MVVPYSFLHRFLEALDDGTLEFLLVIRRPFGELDAAHDDRITRCQQLDVHDGGQGAQLLVAKGLAKPLEHGGMKVARQSSESLPGLRRSRGIEILQNLVGNVEEGPERVADPGQNIEGLCSRAEPLQKQHQIVALEVRNRPIQPWELVHEATELAQELSKLFPRHLVCIDNASILVFFCENEEVTEKCDGHLPPHLLDEFRGA